MPGYVKKLAVIRQVKSGFSADGGSVSGLVSAEAYAGFLKVEVSLINLAPLKEGRYLSGVSDGQRTITFEGPRFEGESELDPENGFAYLLCFCMGGAAPIAVATCGLTAHLLPALKEEMQKSESPKGENYDDEAIAENNYYERAESDENKGAVRQNKEQKKAGGRTQNAGHNSAVKRTRGPLAGGGFYGRMREEIEKIFAANPRESALERAIEGGRFVRIFYGKDKYYVFGVLYSGGAAKYVCYGVPAKNGSAPPPALDGCSVFVQAEECGYWLMYQDAATGVTVPVDRV